MASSLVPEGIHLRSIAFPCFPRIPQHIGFESFAKNYLTFEGMSAVGIQKA